MVLSFVSIVYRIPSYRISDLEIRLILQPMNEALMFFVSRYPCPSVPVVKCARVRGELDEDSGIGRKERE